MAREESDREDLLREATALVERVELSPHYGGDSIVIGFRPNGSLSVFFSGDTAYHFNSDRELRRAYVGGLLYKAEHSQLISLERIRQDNEVQLIRRELSAESKFTFLAAMQATLNKLARQIDVRELSVTGQVPADVDVRDRALKWLHNESPIAVAQSPHAR